MALSIPEKKVVLAAVDLAAEYLYELLTGSAPAWSKQTPSGVPVVAEPKPQYRA